MIEFYLGFRVFYIKSTEEEFYPPLFGAGEVQVGHGGGEVLHGGCDTGQQKGGVLHPWGASQLGQTEPRPVWSSVGRAPTWMCSYDGGTNLCLRTRLGVGLVWGLPGFRKN